MTKNKIIISGGTGLVGSAIVKQLTAEGKSITILTTSKGRSSKNSLVKYSYWNPAKGEVDSSLFSQHDAIINLAGANLAQRWNDAYKKTILNSRTDSTRLLVEECNKEGSSIQQFISASAVGYYPDDGQIHPETSTPGEGFLSDVCVAWEKETNPLLDSDITRSIVRIGVVLSMDGGALAKLLPLFKTGLGSAVGKGSQLMSTIHIEDLAGIFRTILNENWEGIYNGVAPDVISNHSFSKAIATALGRPFFMPKVPSFLMKIALGEMASIVLDGQGASADKLAIKGFQFKFPKVEQQLNNLLKS